jgi:hypothetical protein
MSRLSRVLPIAVLALALPASGCFGKLPRRELYRLAPPDSLFGRATEPDTAGARGGGDLPRPALEGPLGIMRYEAPGLYGERGVVFRIGEAEYGVYPSREWALPLADMLGALTARLAEGTSLSREAPLFDPPSLRGQAWLWRARVREFEEVNRGTALLVAVRLEASIVRASDDSVVWSGSAGREAPVVGGTDMPAVVRTLSGTAAEVIRELLQQAERDLARVASPPVRRPAAPAEPTPRAP